MKAVLMYMWKWVKKHFWYMALLCASSLYVVHYRFEIDQLTEFNAQNLIFILWLILLLFPLFSEMEFFGVKLKRELEKSTSEVKESIHDLQIQIMQTQIANTNNQNLRIENYGPLASAEQLKDILKTYIDTLHPSNTPQNTEEPVVPPDAEYLFKVRLSLETSMRNLCEKLGFAMQKDTISNMAIFLRRNEVLQDSSYDIVKQIINIANRGIHGEIVSTQYIEFVKRTYPNIIQELENARNTLQYTTCPRCKYTGYSKYENVCPQCGFTYDD